MSNIVNESLSDFEISKFGETSGNMIAEAIEQNKPVNEAVAALALGTVLALPAVIKVIGMIIKTGSKLLGWKKGEASGEKLKHFAHKFHEKLIQPIIFVLKKMGVPEDKAEKYAKLIHTLVVALLGVYSGLETAAAYEAANTSKTAMEGLLTAIKGSETGEALIAGIESAGASAAHAISKLVK